MHWAKSFLYWTVVVLILWVARLFGCVKERNIQGRHCRIVGSDLDWAAVAHVGIGWVAEGFNATEQRFDVGVRPTIAA